MDANEYKYLEETLTGRRQRDPEYEAKLRDVINPKTAERQRQIDSMTHEEREIEQRQFSLRMYGPEHMRRYAHPIVTNKLLGELAIPGDQIISASSPQTHAQVDEHKVKIHCGGEEKTWCDANGRLKLQFHEGEKGCYMQKEI